MHKRVTEFFSYRWRYVLGYSFIIVTIGAMLTVAALYVPHELRQGEIDSALISGKLGTSAMSPQSFIDLPYHILQKLSFITLGVTTFTIKLPSIILGTLSVLGIFLLIRTWFEAKVAILATLIATITAQFLFLIQDGTPLIMYTFLSVWLLFVATYVTRRKYFGTLWKVLTALAMAACIYTPMGIYLVIVMLTTSLFHPHIRFMIRKFNRVKASIAIFLGVAALAPLVYAIVLDPSILRTLLGIPVNLDIQANALKILHDTIGFASDTNSYLVRPLYPIGLVLLMLVGLYRILTHRYTARSYITIAWGALTLGLVLLNPGAVTNLYPVAIILISYGIIEMIRSWYQIFPTNPYARVAGMLPLTVLVLAFVMSGTTRFIGTYHNDPGVMSNYSRDLTMLRTTLSKNNATADTTALLVGRSELPFYQLVSKYDNRFSVSSSPVDKKQLTIASRAAKLPDAPTSIVVNARAQDADRFYIYK